MSGGNDDLVCSWCGNLFADCPCPPDSRRPLEETPSWRGPYRQGHGIGGTRRGDTRQTEQQMIDMAMERSLQSSGSSACESPAGPRHHDPRQQRDFSDPRDHRDRRAPPSRRGAGARVTSRQDPALMMMQMFQGSRDMFAGVFGVGDDGARGGRGGTREVRYHSPRYHHHHHHHHGSQPDIDNMSYEEILALQENIGHVSKGLSEDVLEAIPVRKFEGGADTECSICQCPVEAGDEVRGIPCNDIYHKDCIDQWFKEQSTCPVCRMDIREMFTFS
eukprot:TRINITY_DN1356_c2_g1_i1.p1 TRINITY_DN1356_c2_g1~~TRINITY_DN1356_c2_g1_i1.p1  ORF type:complete len:275 (+),score=42.52 TRINITY_DN1356_c2_g1_i1:295-1119(+)